MQSQISEEKFIKRLKDMKIAFTQKEKPKIAGLILSGSFNPPHKSHIQLLKQASELLEKDGWKVLLCWLAPSSNNYVTKKLGTAAFDISDRYNLCDIFSKKIEWLDTFRWGNPSSSSTKNECQQKGAIIIQKELGINISHSLTWTVFEVIGSDTIMRQNLLSRRSNFIAVCRDDEENSAKKLLDQVKQLPSSNRPQIVENPPEEISSTKIRNCMTNNKWDELEKYVDTDLIPELKVLAKKKSFKGKKKGK